MANVLGRAMRYVGDAWRYATNKTSATNPALRQLLLTQRYNTGGQGFGGSGGVDPEMLAKVAVNNPDMFRNLTVSADRVSDEADFHVQIFKENDWVTIKDHSWNRILRHPNDIFSTEMMLRDITWQYNLYGNAYAFVVSEIPGMGPITEAWHLPANKIEPIPESLRISAITNRLTIDYRYRLATEVILPGENVLHFRTPNPFDYWQGLAPLTALQTTLDSDGHQRQWIGSFFADNAVPNAIISLPRELTDPEFDSVREDLIEEFTGRNATAITRAGDFSVEVLQQTLEQMETYAGLSYNAADINKVAGVPGSLSEAASGEARLMAEIALLKDKVMPMLSIMAGEMTLKVVPFYKEPGVRMQIVSKNIVPQDDALQAQLYTTYRPERSIQESREEQGLEPLVIRGELNFLQQLTNIPDRLIDFAAQHLLAQQAPLGSSRWYGNGAEGAMPGDAVPGEGGGDPKQAVVMAMAGMDRQSLVAAMAGVMGNAERQLLVRQMAGQPVVQPGEVLVQGSQNFPQASEEYEEQNRVGRGDYLEPNQNYQTSGNPSLNQWEGRWGRLARGGGPIPGKSAELSEPEMAAMLAAALTTIKRQRHNAT